MPSAPQRRAKPSQMLKGLNDLRDEIAQLGPNVVVESGLCLPTLGVIDTMFGDSLEECQERVRRPWNCRIVMRSWAKRQRGEEFFSPITDVWASASDSEKRFYALVSQYWKLQHSHRFSAYKYTPRKKDVMSPRPGKIGKISPTPVVPASCSSASSSCQQEPVREQGHSDDQEGSDSPNLAASRHSHLSGGPCVANGTLGDTSSSDGYDNESHRSSVISRWMDLVHTPILLSNGLAAQNLGPLFSPPTSTPYTVDDGFGMFSRTGGDVSGPTRPDSGDGQSLSDLSAVLRSNNTFDSHLRTISVASGSPSSSPGGGEGTDRLSFGLEGYARGVYPSDLPDIPNEHRARTHRIPFAQNFTAMSESPTAWSLSSPRTGNKHSIPLLGSPVPPSYLNYPRAVSGGTTSGMFCETSEISSGAPYLNVLHEPPHSWGGNAQTNASVGTMLGRLGPISLDYPHNVPQSDSRPVENGNCLGMVFNDVNSAPSETWPGSGAHRTQHLALPYSRPATPSKYTNGGRHGSEVFHNTSPGCGFLTPPDNGVMFLPLPPLPQSGSVEQDPMLLHRSQAYQ